jgi:hypothetical protein
VNPDTLALEGVWTMKVITLMFFTLPDQLFCYLVVHGVRLCGYRYMPVLIWLTSSSHCICMFVHEIGLEARLYSAGLTSL